MKRLKKIFITAVTVIGLFASINSVAYTPLDRPDMENTGQSMPIGGQPTCVAPGFTCDGNG